jgi:GNAT superfamily N-acetyltransferase
MEASSTAERIARGLCAAERARRDGVDGCDALEVDGLVVLVANVPAPEVNGVVVEREPADALGAFLAAQDLLEARGRIFGADIQAGRHPSVDGAVRALGLRQLFRRPGMAVGVADVREGPVPDGVVIRRVETTTDAMAFAAVDVEAFDDPPEVAERFYAAGLVGLPNVAAFVAWDGPEPIGMAAAYLHEGSVGLLGVGVVPRARRRGVGVAITSRAARAFPSADLAWLHPTGSSRPMYERMGFRPVSTWEVWQRDDR